MRIACKFRSENVKVTEHLEGVNRIWKNNITCNDRRKIRNYRTTLCCGQDSKNGVFRMPLISE